MTSLQKKTKKFQVETPSTWQSLLQLLSPLVQTLPDTADDVALVKLANEQSVLFALFEQLQKKQALQLFEPLTQEYFADLYNQQHQRQVHALQQIADITGLLNAQKITPLYFKGAAALLQGWHESKNSRFFIDIDILLPEPDANKAQQILKNQGYQATQTPSPKRHHHLQSLQHKAWPLSVEIHTQPLSARAGFALPAKAMLAQSEEVQDHKLGCYRLPNINDSLSLLIINAEVAAWGSITGRINLKDALDALALSPHIDVDKLKPEHSAYMLAVLQLLQAPKTLQEGLNQKQGERRLKHFYHWLNKGFNPKLLLIKKLQQRFLKPYLQRKYQCQRLITRPDVYLKEAYAVLFSAFKNSE